MSEPVFTVLRTVQQSTRELVIRGGCGGEDKGEGGGVGGLEVWVRSWKVKHRYAGLVLAGGSWKQPSFDSHFYKEFVEGKRFVEWLKSQFSLFLRVYIGS